MLHQDNHYCGVPVQCLRAGDVILSRSQGPVSRTISILTQTKGTNTKFSHAALLLETGKKTMALSSFGLPAYPYYQLFESDGLGAGFTGLSMNLIRAESKLVSCQVIFPYDSVAMAIYRHPGLAQIPKNDVERAIEVVTSQYYADPYSLIERLAETLALPQSIKTAAQKIAKALTRRPAHPGDTGVFCSELVAILFQTLNLPLFGTPKRPATISPNLLANSNLERVNYTSEPFTPTEENMANIEFNLHVRKSILPILSSSKKAGKVLDYNVKEIQIFSMRTVWDAMRKSESTLLKEINKATETGENSMLYYVDRMAYNFRTLFLDPERWYQKTIEVCVKEALSYQRDLYNLQELIIRYKPGAIEWVTDLTPGLEQDFLSVYDALYKFNQLRLLRIIREHRLCRRLPVHPTTEQVRLIARNLTIQTWEGYKFNKIQYTQGRVESASRVEHMHS